MASRSILCNKEVQVGEMRTSLLPEEPQWVCVESHFAPATFPFHPYGILL